MNHIGRFEVTAHLCPWCLQPSPCPQRCQLTLVEPKRVASGPGFVLVGPGAFTLVMRKPKDARD